LDSAEKREIYTVNKKPVQTIEQWCIDTTLVAAMRENAGEYIRDMANKARKEPWSKRCITTRRILNMIRRCGNPQGLLLETYENMKEAGDSGAIGND
jgi:hypothetical protein